MAAVRAVSVVDAAIVETVADREHAYEAIADFRLYGTSVRAFSLPFWSHFLCSILAGSFSRCPV